MKTLKTSCLFTLCLLVGCAVKQGSKEKKEIAATENIQQISPEKMIQQGFNKGTITVSKSEGCPYILTIEKYKDKLDPINLNDFFKDEIPDKVWVKFANLRMPNRCNEARPVSITEISTRN